MRETLSSQLADTFDLVILRHEARVMCATARDRKQLKTITDRYQAARDKADARHDADYGERYDRARADVLSKRARPVLEPAPPWGATRSLSDMDIDRAAKAQVAQDRANDLASIDREERKELKQMVGNLYKRSAIKDVARDAFNKTVDRRNGQERRVQRQTQ